MKKHLWLLIMVQQGLAGTAQNCPPLDIGFGTSGKAVGYTTSSPNYTPGSKNLFVQPDNRIVQAVSIKNGSNYEFGLIRYRENGIVDSSFGTYGRVTTHIGKYDSYMSSAVLQPDGKIILAGSADSAKWNFALARYLPNGQLDNSFGWGGKLLVRAGKFDDFGRAVALQPDGKILVAGSSGDSLNVQAFAVMRFFPDGTIDSSFGTHGRIIAHYGPLIGYIGTIYYNQYSYENAQEILVQPGGKIVVIGNSYVYSACYDYYGGLYCNPSLAIVRYDTNGALDTTFGIKGKLIDSTNMFYVSAGILQTDGRILVTGGGYSNGFVTQRYTANGKVDSTFGQGGTVLTTAPSFNYGANSSFIALQPDGRLLVGGSVYRNGASDFFLARYLPGGSPDNSFQTDGMLTVHMGEANSYDNATALAFQGNKILLGGVSGSNSNSSVIVGRLQLLMPPIIPLISANGPLNICQGNSVRLRCNETGSIQWFKNNIAIPYATDTVYQVALSGSYTVMASNSTGCGISAPVFVTVYDLPKKPEIYWNGSELSTATGYNTYQWLRNDTVLAGATSARYIPVQTGNYKIEVTNSAGCAITSENYHLVATAINIITIDGTTVRYYPNPARHTLHIDLPVGMNGPLQAELYDVAGRRMLQQSLRQRNNELPLQGFSSGLYQLILYSGREKINVKVMLLH